MSESGGLRDVGSVFVKEVLGLARDRHTIIYSVVLPLFLYPSLVWLALQVAMYLRSVEEVQEPRVLLVGVRPDGPLGTRIDEAMLRRSRREEAPPRRDAMRVGPEGRLQREVLERFQWLRPQGDPESFPGALEGKVDGELVRKWILEDRIDAVLRDAGRAGDPSGPGSGGEASGSVLPLIEPARIEVYFSSARDSSTLASRRLREALEAFGKDRLRDAAGALGAPDGFIEVLDVYEEDHSSRQELANYLASLTLPLILVIMTALGALYPALDTTVGEKERGTLETTLVLPISRLAVVSGKYLAVSLFSFLAFALNFGSMSFTFEHLRAQFQIEGLRLGIGAAAVIFLSAMLLALLLSAFMMVIGFLADSFKEGQTYVTPVYFLAVVPAIFTSAPDVRLTPLLATLPVVNISLLFRETLQGRLEVGVILCVLGATVVYICLGLLMASRLLRREELATGAARGFREGLRTLVPGGRRSGRESR